jgi:hypothetical protein
VLFRGTLVTTLGAITICDGDKKTYSPSLPGARSGDNAFFLLPLDG